MHGWLHTQRQCILWEIKIIRLYQMGSNNKRFQNHHIIWRLDNQKQTRGHHKVKRKRLHIIIVHTKDMGIIFDQLVNTYCQHPQLQTQMPHHQEPIFIITFLLIVSNFLDTLFQINVFIFIEFYVNWIKFDPFFLSFKLIYYLFNCLFIVLNVFSLSLKIYWKLILKILWSKFDTHRGKWQHLHLIKNLYLKSIVMVASKNIKASYSIEKVSKILWSKFDAYQAKWQELHLIESSIENQLTN